MNDVKVPELSPIKEPSSSSEVASESSQPEKTNDNDNPQNLNLDNPKTSNDENPSDKIGTLPMDIDQQDNSVSEKKTPTKNPADPDRSSNAPQEPLLDRNQPGNNPISSQTTDKQPTEKSPGDNPFGDFIEPPNTKLEFKNSPPATSDKPEALSNDTPTNKNEEQPDSIQPENIPGENTSNMEPEINPTLKDSRVPDISPFKEPSGSPEVPPENSQLEKTNDIDNPENENQDTPNTSKKIPSNKTEISPIDNDQQPTEKSPVDNPFGQPIEPPNKKIEFKNSEPATSDKPEILSKDNPTDENDKQPDSIQPEDSSSEIASNLEPEKDPTLNDVKVPDLSPIKEPSSSSEVASESSQPEKTNDNDNPQNLNLDNPKTSNDENPSDKIGTLPMDIDQQDNSVSEKKTPTKSPADPDRSSNAPQEPLLDRNQPGNNPISSQTTDKQPTEKSPGDNPFGDFIEPPNTKLEFKNSPPATSDKPEGLSNDTPTNKNEEQPDNIQPENIPGENTSNMEPEINPTLKDSRVPDISPFKEPSGRPEVPPENSQLEKTNDIDNPENENQDTPNTSKKSPSDKTEISPIDNDQQPTEKRPVDNPFGQPIEPPNKKLEFKSSKPATSDKPEILSKDNPTDENDKQPDSIQPEDSSNKIASNLEPEKDPTLNDVKVPELSPIKEPSSSSEVASESSQPEKTNDNDNPQNLNLDNPKTSNDENPSDKIGTLPMDIDQQDNSVSEKKTPTNSPADPDRSSNAPQEPLLDRNQPDNIPIASQTTDKQPTESSPDDNPFGDFIEPPNTKLEFKNSDKPESLSNDKPTNKNEKQPASILPENTAGENTSNLETEKSPSLTDSKVPDISPIKQQSGSPEVPPDSSQPEESKDSDNPQTKSQDIPDTPDSNILDIKETDLSDLLPIRNSVLQPGSISNEPSDALDAIKINENEIPFDSSLLNKFEKTPENTPYIGKNIFEELKEEVIQLPFDLDDDYIDCSTIKGKKKRKKCEQDKINFLGKAPVGDQLENVQPAGAQNNSPIPESIDAKTIVITPEKNPDLDTLQIPEVTRPKEPFGNFIQRPNSKLEFKSPSDKPDSLPNNETPEETDKLPDGTQQENSPGENTFPNPEPEKTSVLNESLKPEPDSNQPDDSPALFRIPDQQPTDKTPSDDNPLNTIIQDLPETSDSASLRPPNSNNSPNNLSTEELLQNSQPVDKYTDNTSDKTPDLGNLRVPGVTQPKEPFGNFIERPDSKLEFKNLAIEKSDKPDRLPNDAAPVKTDKLPDHTQPDNSLDENTSPILEQAKKPALKESQKRQLDKASVNPTEKAPPDETNDLSNLPIIDTPHFEEKGSKNQLDFRTSDLIPENTVRITTNRPDVKPRSQLLNNDGLSVPNDGATALSGKDLPHFGKAQSLADKASLNPTETVPPSKANNLTNLPIVDTPNFGEKDSKNPLKEISDLRSVNTIRRTTNSPDVKSQSQLPNNDILLAPNDGATARSGKDLPSFGKVQSLADKPSVNPTEKVLPDETNDLTNLPIRDTPSFEHKASKNPSDNTSSDLSPENTMRITTNRPDVKFQLQPLNNDVLSAPNDGATAISGKNIPTFGKVHTLADKTNVNPTEKAPSDETNDLANLLDRDTPDIGYKDSKDNAPLELKDKDQTIEHTRDPGDKILNIPTRGNPQYEQKYSENVLDTNPQLEPSKNDSNSPEDEKKVNPLPETSSEYADRTVPLPYANNYGPSDVGHSNEDMPNPPLSLMSRTENYARKDSAGTSDKKSRITEPDDNDDSTNVININSLELDLSNSAISPSDLANSQSINLPSIPFGSNDISLGDVLDLKDKKDKDNSPDQVPLLSIGQGQLDLTSKDNLNSDENDQVLDKLDFNSLLDQQPNLELKLEDSENELEEELIDNIYIDQDKIKSNLHSFQEADAEKTIVENPGPSINFEEDNLNLALEYLANVPSDKDKDVAKDDISDNTNDDSCKNLPTNSLRKKCRKQKKNESQ